MTKRLEFFKLIFYLNLFVFTIVLNAQAQDLNEHYKLGMIFFDQSKYQKAIEEFTISIRDDNGFADAYKYRALSYERMNEINRATKDLNYYVKLKPYNFDAYIVRGQFFMRMGEEMLALEDFDKALLLNPDYTFGYLYRAACYKNLGDTTNSIKDYLKVESVYPNHIKVLEELAYLYFYTDEPILSIRYCDRFIDLRPEDSEIYLIRAKAFLQLKKTKEACIDFEKALQLGNSKANEFIQKNCR